MVKSNYGVVEALKAVLADTYALYLKTQNYHWNVTGPNFKSLHELFALQYQEYIAAIDEIAEMIRGFGNKAPGTFKAFEKLTSIRPGNENADAETMIQELADDQESLQKVLNEGVKIAQKAGEEDVADLFIGRLAVHRKNAWMLKSSL